MKCKFCGAKLNKNDPKCPKCGRNVYGTRGKGASNRNRKLLLIGGILLASLIVCTLIILVLNNTVKNNKIDSTMIDSANKEFMMTNVPADYKIKINSNDSNYTFSVEDIINETVVVEAAGVQGNITIHPPAGGYEKGEIYSCDLKGHGTFENKECFGADKITFVIAKKKTLDITYTDKVIELPYGKADISGKNITIEGEYKTNDIILTDTDGDNIQEIYKIHNVSYSKGKTFAETCEPKADEIYEDIDIFYCDEVDLSKAEIDKNSLAVELDESGILDAFIESVHASSSSKEDISSDVTKQKTRDGCKFVLTIKDKKNDSISLKITFKVSNKILYKNNGKTVAVNNITSINGNVKVEIKGLEKQEKDKLRKRIASSGKPLNAGKFDKNNPQEYELQLIPLKIPIAGPVYGHFSIGVKAEYAFGGEIDFNMNTGCKIVEGAVYSLRTMKLIKKYGNNSPNGKNYNLLAVGEGSVFAGGYVKGGVAVPYLCDVDLKGEAGPYGEYAGGFMLRNIPDNPKMDGYYNVELGAKAKIELEITALRITVFDATLYEKKIKIYRISNEKQLKSLDVNDKYALHDNSIYIGTLIAKYEDVIEDTTEEQQLKKYKLRIDGKKVEVNGDRILGDFSTGKHTFEFKWKYDDIPMEYEKEVEITEFDPWSYFKNVDISGKKVQEIEEFYGKATSFGEGEGHTYFELSDSDYVMILSWSDLVDYDYFENGALPKTAACMGMSGTAENLFGLTEPISVAEFNQIMNMDEDIGCWFNNMYNDYWWGGVKGSYYVELYEYENHFTSVEDKMIYPDTRIDVCNRKYY